MFKPKTKKLLRRFLLCYRPYAWQFSLVLFCALASTAASLLLPLCTRYITKNILEGGDGSLAGLLPTVGIMLVIIAVRLVTGWHYDRMGHIIGAAIERDLREEAFAHLLKLPMGYFDRQNTGSLMSRVVNDLHDIAEFCHHGPENFMLYFLGVIGALIILFSINTVLAVIAAAAVPVMILYTVIFIGRLLHSYQHNFKTISQMNSVLADSLSGIRVIKSFTGEAQERSRFSKANAMHFEARKSIYSAESFFYAGNEYLLIPLLTVTVIAVGALRITGGDMDVADLLAFIMYLSYLTGPMTRLVHFTEQFQEARAGFGRFIDLMDIEPEAGGDALPGLPVRGELCFEGADFAYDESGLVVRGLDLTVPAGSTLAIVGTSGAGKTTLCALISRLYPLAAGSLTLDGMPVEALSLLALRREIGVVEQDTYLFSGTVLENLRYAKPGATLDEVEAAARLAFAHDFIAALPKGYDTEIGQRGVRLSGGQRQRLSIASVFLKAPPILIFDEATSALDYETERCIQESLRRFSQGRTTIIIAHRLSTVRQADSIAVLSGQEIVELGSHDRLMAQNGVYKGLYQQMTL